MKTTITINYKNGNTLTEDVNYLHFENGCIYYTVERKIQSMVTVPVEIPLENIESFDLVKNDK